MSWSVNALGRALAVRTAIAKQFENQRCQEPEESIRLSAAKLIDEALAAQAADKVVKVAASGSQSFANWNDKTGVQNYLNILVEPQHNFIE